MMKTIIRLFCLWFLISFHPVLAQDQELIYIAGNPDLYPLEYYDPLDQEFKGVIPDFFEQLSSKSSYEFQYLNTLEDERNQKYKNNQAEIISGCVAQDELWNQGVTFLKVDLPQFQEIRLVYTPLADASLQELIETAINEMEESDWLALFTKIQSNQTTRPIGLWLALFVLFFLCLGLLVKLYQDHKKIQQLQNSNRLDLVTGLGNKYHLLDYYDQFVNDKNRILYHLIYFYTDVQSLYQVSEGNCDDFFRYIAIILKEYASDTDILARVAEGGFVLLHLSYTKEENENWIKTIMGRLSEYSSKFNKPYETQVVAGIYPLQQNDLDLDMILYKAEQTSYYALMHHLSYVSFDENILSLYEEESELKQRLKEALQKQEFELYLHFFVDARKGVIVGAEALTRWMHPKKGMLMPSRYIPLLENEGTIELLDYYVLELVCSFLEKCYVKHHLDFFVSCNFSRKTFASPNFVEKSIEIMNRYHFPKEEVLFELTERGPILQDNLIYKNALRLKKEGLRVVLDDFGAGLSNFNDLKEIRFDGLKIDRELILSMNNPLGETIVRSIVQICDQLSMTVLAEGVETKQQVDQLLDMNCQVIQGFYYYQPMPIHQAFSIILKENIEQTN